MSGSEKAQSWLGSMLSAIPMTGRDEPTTEGNVVSLEPRDPYKLPPVADGLWRSLFMRRAEIGKLLAERHTEHAKRAAALAEYDRKLGNIEHSIVEQYRKIKDDVNRWDLMSGPIDQMIAEIEAAINQQETMFGGQEGDAG